MLQEECYRGRSPGESRVVHAVWDEVGGELVEEFVVPTLAGDPSRDRQIDGVFATDGPRRCHPARHRLELRGRDVVVCQAKVGQLDLGVLGQTLFAAELIDRQCVPRRMRLIAAAEQPNPLIERLLESYRPFGRKIETRIYKQLRPPDVRPGRPSGASAPPAVRKDLISAVHSDVGGLLISRTPRSRAHFRRVRVDTSGEPLRQADPDAIILPGRRSDEVTATISLDVAAEEQVVLAYVCTDLYMTAMGRAVFGGEIARRLLGLAHVTSFLCYRNDNAALRALMGELQHLSCRQT